MADTGRAMALGRKSGVAVHDAGIPAALLAAALAGWWWSVQMAGDMHSMSLAAFVVAWAAMMAAMMFPAISPVVRLYARAAAQGTVAPLPFFVAGYLLVWTCIALPAYFAWQGLAGPLDEGAVWAARLAGGTLVAAAAYQFSPIKSACLRHCRSPISFFLRFTGNTATPTAGARLGVTHGAFCLGCCWALMAVLVAVGTMNLAWMAALTVVIFAEKVAPRGETLAIVAAGMLAIVGVVLLIDPSSIRALT